MAEGLEIIYHDDHLVVAFKPAGLLCVPGRGADKQDCLSAQVQARFSDALVVHRLDMATSGLVLMARGLVNQRVLSSAFANRQVHKTYTARVAGDALAVAPGAATAWQTIDLPLCADWPNRPRQKVDLMMGKPSLTRWRLQPAADSGDCEDSKGLLELEPVTGRTHQLRVHLASIGMPILGDQLYAPPDIAQATNRLMLHARSLSFKHPETLEEIYFIDNIIL